MTFTSASKLKTHQRKHSGEKPYQCDQCDKAYAQSFDLKRHKQTHSGIKSFQCDLCDKAFFWSGSLRQHKKQHAAETLAILSSKHREIPEEVEKCGNAENNETDVDFVMGKSEQPVVEMDCVSPGNNIVNPTVVQSKTGQKVKNFNCDICGKDFVWKKSLQSHRKKQHAQMQPSIAEETDKNTE